MECLTVAQVSKIFQVPALRVYELIRQGRLPVVRLGRQVRVQDEALRRWMDGGGQGLPSPEEPKPQPIRSGVTPVPWREIAQG